MEHPLILKGAYKGLTQSALVNFAENVIDRMSTKPEYQPFAADITLLSQQLTAYRESLYRAVNRATDYMAIKEECKKAVLRTLDRITDQLNFNHNGLESWGLNAGMEVMREKQPNSGDLEAPSNLQVLSKGIRGEAILTFKVEASSSVRTYGAEYSTDNGETWRNGHYSTNSTMKLKDLPSRQALLFRVCAIGTFQRKSAWAGPVEGFVL
jgi:hypothetical protein